MPSSTTPLPTEATPHGAPVRQYINGKITGVLLEGMKIVAREQYVFFFLFFCFPFLNSACPQLIEGIKGQGEEKGQGNGPEEGVDGRKEFYRR